MSMVVVLTWRRRAWLLGDVVTWRLNGLVKEREKNEKKKNIPEARDVSRLKPRFVAATLHPSVA